MDWILITGVKAITLYSDEELTDVTIPLKRKQNNLYYEND